MRPTAFADADVVAPPTRAAREVQLIEIFTRLKEKTELMRRHVLALAEETGAALAMRGDLMSTSSPRRSEPHDALWKALPRIGDCDECCPQCCELLQPFPPATSAMLICTLCGFVAKQVAARQERLTLAR